MAIPPTTILWPETIDPSDYLDFLVDCTSVLEPDETVVQATTNIPAESVLLGLTLDDIVLNAGVLSMWISIDPTKQSAVEFAGTGVTLPIEISITTSAARKWQRTVAVKVAQK